MLKHAWYALLFTACLAGCSKQPVAPRPPLRPPVFGAEDSVFTDAQVLAAVYTSYRWPDGFYHENETAIAPYYVNTVSIKPVCCRPADDWRELATDDVAVARAWADSSTAYGNGVAPLADGDNAGSSERFFEFQPDASSPYTQVPMRVHKASYFDPSMYNLWTSDPMIGIFNHRPIDSESVRGLVEYQWYRRYHQILGFKVLSSFSRGTADGLIHTLFTTETTFSDHGACDIVRLYRLRYHVSVNDGRVDMEKTLIRQISGNCHARREAPLAVSVPTLPADALPRPPGP